MMLWQKDWLGGNMGKGSSDVTVSTYYLGARFVVCHGPIDKLTAIRVDKRNAWTGNSTGGTISIDKPELFGGESREGGIVGDVDVEMGDSSQPVNSYLSSLLGSAIPAYRGLTSIILKKVYVGNNYYLKPWSALVTRIHTRETGIPQWQDALAEIPGNTTLENAVETITNVGTLATVTLNTPLTLEEGATIIVSDASPAAYNGTFTSTVIDEETFNYTMLSDPGSDATGTFTIQYEVSGLMNAVHMLREVMTSKSFGFGYPEGKLNGTSWLAAAQTCFDEGLGFAFLFANPISKADMIDEISRHIQATVYLNRQTGLFDISLVRKVTDTGSLLILDESNTKLISGFKRTLLPELASSVTVRYVSNEYAENSSATITDTALLQKQEVPVSKTATYNGIATSEVAMQIAARDLRQYSTPVYSLSIEASRAAEFLNKNDAFRFYRPDIIDKELLLRVVSIDLGTPASPKIKIKAVEDMFRAADTLYAVPSLPKWKNPINLPQLIVHKVVQESPYYMIAISQGDSFAQGVDVLESFIVATGVKPTQDSISAGIWTATGTEYVGNGIMDFCGTGTLFANIDKQDTTITLTNIQDIEDISEGNFIQLNEEFLEVTNIAGNVFTVVRGVLDTIPESHLAGDRIYGIGDFQGSDYTAYTLTEAVSVKLTTKTPRGELSINDVSADVVTIDGRMHKPYPPANIKIDGTYWPVSQVTGDFTVTWATRNRLQQTAGFFGFYTGDITTEVGVTYDLTLLRTDTSAEISSYTGIATTSQVMDVTVSGDSSLITTHSITNPGAETGDTTGWANETGALGVRPSGSPVSYEGSYHFFGGTSAITIASSTTVDLIADGVLAVDIDAGSVIIKTGYQQASFSGSDSGKLGIRFLDGSDVLISEIYNTLQATSPSQTWDNRIDSHTIPATTRKIKVLIYCDRNAGTNNDAYFDAITVESRLGLVPYDYVGEVELTATSHRDGLVCEQPVTHTFNLT